MYITKKKIILNIIYNIKNIIIMIFIFLNLNFFFSLTTYVKVLFSPSKGTSVSQKSP